MPSAPRKHTQRMRRVKQHRIVDKGRAISNVFKGLDRDGKEYVTSSDPRKTARWQKVRLVVLRRQSLCYDPLEHHDKYDEAEPATDVHHIKLVRQYHHLAYSLDNLVGLCRRCHNRVDSMEEKGKNTQELFNWSVSDDKR